MRRSAVAAWAALVIALASGVAEAQLSRVFGRAGRVEFQPFRAPDERFSIEYPKRDWQIVPGSGSVVVTFAHKRGEAAVALEHVRLNQSLAPSEITDLFAQLEADEIKERQPKAGGFTRRVVDESGRRIIVIEFTRPGFSGPERVRHYSIPSGTDLFRLICSGPSEHFEKHQTVFAHMTASFRVLVPRDHRTSASPERTDVRPESLPPDAGTRVTPPSKRKHVAPVYPRNAFDRRMEGMVTIEAAIGEDGRVSAAKVVKSVPLFDEAALAAVRQWEFVPATMDGRPVPFVITTTVEFSLGR